MESPYVLSYKPWIDSYWWKGEYGEVRHNVAFYRPIYFNTNEFIFCSNFKTGIFSKNEWKLTIEPKLDKKNAEILYFIGKVFWIRSTHPDTSVGVEGFLDSCIESFDCYKGVKTANFMLADSNTNREVISFTLEKDTSSYVTTVNLNQCALLIYVYEKILVSKINKVDLSKDLFTDYDIVFKGKGWELKAHKKLLTKASPVFSKMFQNQFIQSKTVKMLDFPNNAVKQFLLYLYTSEITIDYGNAEDLFKLAHLYEIQSLQNLTEAHLCCNVGDSNVCRLMISAISYKAKALKEYCTRWIVYNFESISESKEYRDMTKKHKNEKQLIRQHQEELKEFYI